MAERLYVDEMPKPLKIKRLLWQIVHALLFRPTPRFAMNGWRLRLLRLFGAEIGKGCRVAPDCFVWAPWNLKMGVYACLADGVDCYSQGRITMGDYSTVSQRAFLCTASHSIRTLERPLFSRPITIAPHAWICAEAFIGPGVTVGEGAVVGARAVAMRDVAPWMIVAGNPGKVIGTRQIEGTETANAS
ncbi:putative colanic acid biosynthesis acetyltransferase [Mangrovicoccus sp. HB161399]|uniref:putative colanic acid biosynthesis acetyltransferase n=1 Tax=Mangrovicoccus sp. HB161399 TaxID=2720392 RepID=UPI001556F735|nr:putative colanic acid biosynthesis acetyltransferase [Mangrovicoccus sp. HB161399]